MGGRGSRRAVGLPLFAAQQAACPNAFKQVGQAVPDNLTDQVVGQSKPSRDFVAKEGSADEPG